jgi:hypothetical protein
MENIDEIKVSIMKKFEEMLEAGLVSLQDGGKFSSSEIGKEIGKFINQEIKDIRKGMLQDIRKPRGGGRKKKSDDESEKSDEKPEKKPRAPRKKKTDGEEKPEKKKRAPSAWNIYYKIKSAELKAENEENGIKKSPKEMMADIALLWKEDKATFKVPSDEEAEEHEETDE